MAACTRSSVPPVVISVLPATRAGADRSQLQILFDIPLQARVFKG
jgi:hypothetical protein